MFPAPGGALGSCGISFAAAASFAGGRCGWRRRFRRRLRGLRRRRRRGSFLAFPRVLRRARRRLLLGNRRAVSREVLRMRERRRAQTHERVPRHQRRYDSRGGVRPAPRLAERFVSSSFRRSHRVERPVRLFEGDEGVPKLAETSRRARFLFSDRARHRLRARPRGALVQDARVGDVVGADEEIGVLEDVRRVVDERLETELEDVARHLIVVVVAPLELRGGDEEFPANTRRAARAHERLA